MHPRSFLRGPFGVYYVAALLYLLGVWLHFPYGGGHIYSDIVSVFQVRECTSGGCLLPVPYLQTFVEYPVIVSMFIYTMGVLGRTFGGDLIATYYLFTCIFL